STDWRRWASSAPGHFVGNALLGQTCVWPARYFFEELSKKICDGSCGTRQLGWRILDLGLWRQGSCPDNSCLGAVGRRPVHEDAGHHEYDAKNVLCAWQLGEDDGADDGCRSTS